MCFGVRAAQGLLKNSKRPWCSMTQCLVSEWLVGSGLNASLGACVKESFFFEFPISNIIELLFLDQKWLSAALVGWRRLPAPFDWPAHSAPWRRRCAWGVV